MQLGLPARLQCQSGRLLGVELNPTIHVAAHTAPFALPTRDTTLDAFLKSNATHLDGKAPFTLAGRAATIVRWHRVNASANRQPAELMTMTGDTHDLSNVLAVQQAQPGAVSSAEGSVHYTVKSVTGQDLLRSSHRLWLNPDQEQDFLTNLERQATGAAVLVVGNVSDTRNLPLLREVQDVAYRMKAKFVVNATGPSLRYLIRETINNSGIFDAVQISLTDLCKIIHDFAQDDTSLDVEPADPTELKQLAEAGQIEIVFKKIYSHARKIANGCLVANTGHLILNCGPAGIFIFTSGRKLVLHVPAYSINAQSSGAVAESVLAQYIDSYFNGNTMNLGRPKHEDIQSTRLLTAAAAATAELPFDLIGGRERIRELARTQNMEVQELKVL